MDKTSANVLLYLLTCVILGSHTFYEYITSYSSPIGRTVCYTTLSAHTRQIIPQDNIIVLLVFAVIDNYSLPIKLILVNQH